jgi:hypothetical protein
MLAIRAEVAIVIGPQRFARLLVPQSRGLAPLVSRRQVRGG